MDFNLLESVIRVLQSSSPLKARKLIKLLNAYKATDDLEEKQELKRKIRNFVYVIFYSCLSKRCREELSTICCTINEECYRIERCADSWYVNEDGARRYQLEGEKFVETAFVPREYKKGYYLRDMNTADLSEAERKEKIREGNFYYTYAKDLGSISDLMDRKLEIVSYGYELKSPDVDRRFVELLMSCLKIRRLTDKELEENNVLKK